MPECLRTDSRTSLVQDLQTACRSAGFPISGAIDYVKSIDAFQTHLDRYDEWLAKKYSGPMEYLVRGRDRRADPRRVFPELQSILCVGLPYGKNPAHLQGPARVARYIQGEDYHTRIARMLEGALTEVQKKHPALKYKIAVDSSAVLERSWAMLAGLGWIGKNTLLIHPKHGSYFFIGVALLNLETGQAPSPLPNYCGGCTRCLSACPTGALIQSGELDARRCISTLTLETRGEITDPTLRAQMGNWIAGCDICQEVCPFNIKPDAELWPAIEGAEIVTDWQRLTSESREDYLARTARSALSRIKPEMMKRNVEIALANQIDQPGVAD